VLGTLQALPAATPAASALLGAVAEGTVATVAWTTHEDLWGVPGSVRAAAPSEGAPSAGAQVTLTGEVSAVLSPEAAHVLVLAEAPGGPAAPGGPLLVAVDAGAAGLTRTSLPVLDLTRRIAKVTFAATPARLVGAAGGAAAILDRVLDVATTALAAEQVGAARACLEASTTYAKDRVQFGRQIGTFQAVKHKA
ncbi:acyl-CoA dehydrogenase, partial [Frankia sp. AiPs1]|uniref:acyl-CoA dehydrogenase family protein n=1 Tax=Frankia sp. AiPs1 TaxID=573493 RepID=UPI00255A7460